MVLTSEVIYAAFFVLCIIGTQGKPSLSFNFPSLAIFSGFSGAREQRQTSLKEYSGKRFKNDSLLMVYFHDQTVAVVELGPKKLLLNCEFVEVYEPQQALKVLGELKELARPVYIPFLTFAFLSEPQQALKVLGELKELARPVYISLKEMLTLMAQCEQLDMSTYSTISPTGDQTTPAGGRGILSNNPLTLLSGIIPGTKWCGTGDIAMDYYDLGAEPNVDRCCRAHDLCPVKVRAYSKRYNLTNNSLYTKSHCQCDDNLYDCLKTSESPTAHIMGNVYFNLIQVPCVEELEKGRAFRKAKRFTSKTTNSGNPISSIKTWLNNHRPTVNVKNILSQLKNLIGLG